MCGPHAWKIVYSWSFLHVIILVALQKIGEELHVSVTKIKRYSEERGDDEYRPD